MLGIPRAVLDEIHAEARAGAPDEICGILAGHRGGASHVVSRAIAIRNAHERPRTAYLLDPREQLRWILEIEDKLGLELVGFYHSHPAGPAAFSRTDAAEASWPGAIHLLVHLAPVVGERAARFDESSRALVDEPIEITSSDRAS